MAALQLQRTCWLSTNQYIVLVSLQRRTQAGCVCEPPSTTCLLPCVNTRHVLEALHDQSYVEQHHQQLLTPSAVNSLQMASSVRSICAWADCWFQLLHNQLSQSPKNLRQPPQQQGQGLS